MKDENNKNLTINQEAMDIIVANVIPTTKYFESRFDFMQHQIDEIKNTQKEMKQDMDERFDKIDKRFTSMQQDIDKRFISMQQDIDKRFTSMQQDIDKRFTSIRKEMDERFDKVDRKFETITNEIHNLTLEVRELGKKQEVTIRDYIIERDRHYDQKFARHRNYFLAISGIIVTIMLKMAGIINLPTINQIPNSNQSQIIFKTK